MSKLKSEPALTKPIRILIIVAHPSDVEFFALGSIIRWIDEGAEAIYCIVTDGGAGSNVPDTSLEKLIETRREQQLASATHVRVTDVRFLGYPDGILEPTLELRRDLTRIIRDVKPDRLLCDDPTALFFGDHFINHADHLAAGRAAVHAVFPSAQSRPIFPELLEEGYEPCSVREVYLHLTHQPNVFVDITDTIDRKLEALAYHFGEGAQNFTRHENSVDGEKNGVEYAETFRVMRPVTAS